MSSKKADPREVAFSCFLGCSASAVLNLKNPGKPLVTPPEM